MWYQNANAGLPEEGILIQGLIRLAVSPGAAGELASVKIYFPAEFPIV